MTLFHEFFEAVTAARPASTALRHQDKSYRYSELSERSTRLASALRSRGVARGDRVAVYLKNRPEVVEIMLACSRIGAICVPINPMLRSRQLAYILSDCGAGTLVMSAAAGAGLQLESSPKIELIVACDSGRGEALPGAAVAYEELLTSEKAATPFPGIDKDPALVLYTSSSTGMPKGVVVSHLNVVSGAKCVAQYLGNKDTDRILAALPLSFDYGLSQVTTAFAVGACAVLTHYSMATTLIRDVDTEAITGLAGVPTMWAHLAASEWPTGACATLRYATNSGGVLAPVTLRKLQSRMPHVRFFKMYGLTEAFRSTYLDPAELARRPHSIGKAIPNQEVFVLRPDGSHCDPNEAGELVHRGSLVTLGYWNDPEATRLRFRPLRDTESGLAGEIAVWSGDLVKRDDDGFVYFLGRKDQQIKTSGYRISPTEIEEVAMEVPGTIEAIVVGLPDAVLGHRLALAVVKEDGAGDDFVERVRQHCRKNLPAFMMPAHILSVASIPRTPNGKHDYAAVRTELKNSLSTEADLA